MHLILFIEEVVQSHLFEHVVKRIYYTMFDAGFYRREVGRRRGGNMPFGREGGAAHSFRGLS